MLLAAGLGVVGGWGLADALRHGGHASWWGLGLLFAVWPLSWMATVRIARPVEDLAQVAADLRDGQLGRRDQLAVRTDEVGEVADALHGIAARLSDQLEAQRALLAAVSHELRSPLARMRVMVELSREGGVPQHDDLQSEIGGMDALVGDLLAAARIDFEAISMADLAARQIAERALEMAGLPSSTLADGEDARVRADPTLLARALVVLLDNAQRYGGQTVQLRVLVDGTEVRFEVLDDGPGFESGVEEQVFQPFWRPAGSARPEGLGLGLALARQIARAHGGDAAAANRPDGGARVWILLPRA